MREKGGAHHERFGIPAERRDEARAAFERVAGSDKRKGAERDPMEYPNGKRDRRAERRPERSEQRARFPMAGPSRLAHVPDERVGGVEAEDGPGSVARQRCGAPSLERVRKEMRLPSLRQTWDGKSAGRGEARDGARRKRSE